MISTCERSSRRLWILGTFLALCLLAACSGSGQATQDISLRVKETPAELVALPTQPSQVSTPTPESTEPPTLTATPSPAPTSTPRPPATPTPTPTPIPLWSFEEYGGLPSLTQENASIEVVDSNIELTFRVDNERSQLNGQKFGLTIPENMGPNEDGTFLTLTGEMVEASLVVDPLRESAPKGLEFVPGIKMVDAEGAILAQFDTEAGIWRNTYETIEEGLGQQEVQAWMPQDLGVLESRYIDVDGSESEWKSIVLIGAPQRILDWNIFGEDNKFKKTVQVMEIDAGANMPAIYAPFGEDGGEREFNFVSVGQGGDISAEEYNGYINSHTQGSIKSSNAVYEMLSKSPRLHLSLILFDPQTLSQYSGISDWSGRYGNGDGPGGSWHLFTMGNQENYARLEEFFEDVLKSGVSEIDEILIGPEAWGVFK